MISKYLKQPYPIHFNKWKLIVSISLFIGIFILIFQPFGLSDVNGTYKSVFLLGYGVVTFIVLVVNLVIVQKLFRKWFESWTVLKQICWLTWLIFCIGLGNFIYTAILSNHWNWQIFILFQFFTLVVGLFPIVILTILNQNRLLAQNFKLANEFNQSLKDNPNENKHELITLLADNEKDSLEIELSDLLYIESNGNYIEVYFINENQLKNVLLRSTLKRTELQLEKHSSVLKCHRAFLVNASKIAEVKGNSQGHRLALKHTDTEIPVSRNFSKSLKEKLNSLR